MKNVCELKHFGNFKASGLSLLAENLHTFLKCDVLMQMTPVANFEEHFKLDIHTNINRNCYKISEKKIALIIKVFGEEYGSVDAVFPIVLVGENITCIENSLYEIIINFISNFRLSA